MKDGYKEIIIFNDYCIEYNIFGDIGYMVWFYVMDLVGFIIFIGLFIIIIVVGIVVNEFNWGIIKLLMICLFSCF